MEKERLERFYTVLPWFNDPESKRGREYFRLTLGFMGKLLSHPWFEEARAGGRLRVLEVCGGAGFGGVALAKLLQEGGCEVELFISDLRDSTLKRAEKLAERELGRGIRTVCLDARKIHELDERFDLVLMYGLSTPHFDPWELVALLASAGEALRDEGIMALDESDRRYRIFLLAGYKWAMAEGEDKDPTISFHLGYDLKRGTLKRVYLKPGKEGPVTAELFMWGLAEVGAFMWCFFEELDLVPLREERHFILGRRPRRALRPGDLGTPCFLR